MDITPAVSVILPTYNRATVLGEAIDSVRAQTFNEWELIVVDDGSTDGTATVVERSARRDGRIDYVRAKQGGVSAARNLGIQKARGEFVAFLDDDDLWLPEKLTRQVQALGAHPHWAFVYTQAELRFVDGESRRLRLPLATTFETLLARNTIVTPSLLARREALREVGGFNERMAVMEDVDLFLRVASRHPFGVLSEALTICRPSRARYRARHAEGSENHIRGLRALMDGPITRERRRLIRQKIAREHYTLARLARQDTHPSAAAVQFLRALRADPTVGLACGRPGARHAPVSLLKPYAGVLVCGLQGLVRERPSRRGAVGTSRTRILIIEHARTLGGSMFSLCGVLSRLDQARFEPIILLDTPGAPSRPFEELNLRVIRLHKPFDRFFRHRFIHGPLDYALYGLQLLCSALPQAAQLAWLLKRERIDLVHLNNQLGQVGGILAARLCGVPLVCHLRNARLLRRTHLAMARQVDAFVALSAFSRDWYNRQGLARERLHVIHNPVIARDVSATGTCAALRRSLGVPDDGTVVTIFSRIAPGKGHEVFLRAAAQVSAQAPSTWFVIAGEDPAEGELMLRLQTLAKTLSVAHRVSFAGWRGDIPALLSATQIVVDASELQEGLRRTVLEAMAMGRPVVVTDAGEEQGFLQDGARGLLVPRGNPARMAQAILELLHDPDRREAMGRAARAHVLSLHNPERSARALEALYDALLGARTAP